MSQVPARHLRSWTLASAGVLSVVCAGTVGVFASGGSSASASTAGTTHTAAAQRGPVSTISAEPGRLTWAEAAEVTATPTSSTSARPSTTTSENVKVAASPTTPRTSQVDLFFVPHPDDETLSMGAAIRQSVRAGREVHVVLVTDGGRPGTTTVGWVNQRLVREGLPKLKEGASMVAARAAEFMTATQRLGVPSAHVHLAGESDGTLTKASAMAVIDEWAQRFPGATLHTMSWLDIHPDHYQLGYALDQYCLDHDLGMCRFTQFQRFVRESLAPSAFPVVSPPGQWVQGDDQVRAAANEYRRWDPSRGRYAIGWLYSVPSQFAYLSKNCRSWVHGTSATWDDAEERYASQEWARTHQVKRPGGGVLAAASQAHVE